MKTELYVTHLSSNQQEQTLMVWPCHKERCRFNAEGCNEVKDEGKQTKWKTTTKVARHIDSHLKGKNTSLKEVLETRCFENREDWRALISR